MSNDSACQNVKCPSHIPQAGEYHFTPLPNYSEWSQGNVQSFYACLHQDLQETFLIIFYYTDASGVHIIHTQRYVCLYIYNCLYYIVNRNKKIGIEKHL